MSEQSEINLQGIVSSNGIAIGPVYLHKELKVDITDDSIYRHQIPKQKLLFRDAIQQVKDSLQRNYEITADEYGESFASIFKGQIALIEDEFFLSEVDEQIQTALMSAEAATFKVFSEKREYFLKLDNEYFKDRAFDIHDLKRQIIYKIRGESRDFSLAKPSIIVAKDITPSDTVHFKRSQILGFITEFGGRTSHASIMARSLNIPSITGVRNVTSFFRSDEMVVLDGNKGHVIIHPGEETLSAYYVERFVYSKYLDQMKKYGQLDSKLADGTEIELLGNIEFPEEAEEINHYRLDGVGLYRSEGYFLKHDIIPSEETQFNEYNKLRQVLPNKEVIIRTLDIGGDKIHDTLSNFHEDNPFLGWRAIRMCLDEIGVFQTQLRAIFKASKGTRFKIMLPMVTDISEIQEAFSVIDEVKRDLMNMGVEIREDIPIGIMIETPASAIMIDDFMAQVDFVSIGTNDLIQYTLAVDRGNEKVSYLYQALHPAVLQLIKLIIDAGQRHGKPVSMCGEMASDPLAFPVLVGMGLRHFSMTPRKSLEIKRMIASLKLSDCEQLYQKTLKHNNYIENRKAVEAWVKHQYPDLIY